MDTDLSTEINNKLAALTKEDWERLADLYEAIINHQGDFSSMGGGEPVSEGVVTMGYVKLDPIVGEVTRFFSEKELIVPFDWSNWSEGDALLKEPGEDRFENINTVDVVKLMTAVIRADRTSDGALAELFDSGSARLLIKRLLDHRPA